MPLTKERKKAYAEVCEILNHMSKTDVEKIPKEILSYYSENADKKYSFKYDETKTFAEQKLSYIAKVVLAMFYRDYWATQEERDSITKKEKLDIKKQKEESQTDKNVLSIEVIFAKSIVSPFLPSSSKTNVFWSLILTLISLINYLLLSLLKLY